MCICKLILGFLFLCVIACFVTIMFAIISVIITGNNDIPENWKLFKDKIRRKHGT